MLTNFFKYISLVIAVSVVSFAHAQRVDTSTWKAQVSLGVNSPSKSGFVEAATAKSLNFPTVNLGVQRMFSKQLGAKLDYGFNRFSNEDDSPEFKINYSRINAQLVYDPTPVLYFLPQEMRLVGHTGPGFSFVKPLSNLDENKQSYLNWNAGLEIHYAINQKVSLYTDVSYIYGFTSLDDYDPSISGLGAFNGTILNITLGVSLSLSGCQYCD
ncbi:outer membrane beta-barrel protein [Winogradskyella sp. A3E31]|uniref:outer membrane beta-barrel protein n=1 Tax=Winogradskyella sp. A3E31 TaxID=3349637 RepID=UPI00398ADADF